MNLPQLPPINANVSFQLNVLRALAALMVVTGHVTSVVFLPLSAQPGWLSSAFVALNSLGQHGVVIFFVLSGFLVGRKAIDAVVFDKPITHYLIDRATRIYVVLLPALLAGALLDYVMLFRLRCEACQYIYDRFNVKYFISNLFGLQDILTGVFGSNGPLWSLSFEMWYYALFPAALFVYFGWRRRGRVIAAALLGLALLLLPTELKKDWLLWMLGAAMGFVPMRICTPYVAWGLLVALLASASSDLLKIPGLGFAHLVGTAAAVALIINACQYTPRSPTPWLARPANVCAGFSYSVYLFHFPLLVLLSQALFRIQPGKIEFAGLLIWIATIACLYAYSYAMYLLTERHYPAVRQLTYQLVSLLKIQRVESAPRG